jgi:glycosyltransferase involved in cell wall biosynthesis
VNSASRTTLVVPCYNEAGRIRPEAFSSFLDDHADTDFVFVDDGSTDETASILAELASGRNARGRVVHLRENRGKAEAVRRGVLAAFDEDPNFIGFWDADLATPLHALSGFVEVMRRRPSVEIVMGSRVKLLGRQIRRRAMRHYPGRVFATLASLVLDLPVYDTQCGAKLFRDGPRTRSIFREPFIAGWIFDVELLARYLELLRVDAEGPSPEDTIYELPLRRWTDVGGSKTRPADFLRAAVDLARIWYRYRPAASPPGFPSSANAGDS